MFLQSLYYTILILKQMPSFYLNKTCMFSRKNVKIGAVNPWGYTVICEQKNILK